MTDTEQIDLYATWRSDTWTVDDPNGGIWWPNTEANADIFASNNPAATAIRICSEEPTRGTWHS